MQALIAQGVLILWPLVALVLYMTMSAGRATIWTLLAGYLLLPRGVAFDLPGIPAFDKSTIPSLAAFVLALATSRRGEFKWPRSKALNLLMLGFVLTPFATALTNRDFYMIGSMAFPALGFREGLSMSVGHVITLAPFVLGAGLLGNERGHRQILLALVIGALAYSIPIMLEVRLSPFLQRWVYGIEDAEYFLQQMRFGGFRSMVFLGHGLLVSAFLAMALLAAIGLGKMRVALFGLPMSLIVVFLAVVLVLNKSLGAMLLVLLLAPLLLFLRPRLYLTIMAGLALMVVTYPALRGSGLIPLQDVVQTIRSVSPDRAESLDFRLRNEEILLTRAQQKPLFGWGTFGRNRVIVVTHWGGTVDISVTDGTWIIVIGMLGWVGYFFFFGLLTYPFWRILRFRRFKTPTATLTLAAVHMFNLLDLIPNSSLGPVTWLIAGALCAVMNSKIKVNQPKLDGDSR
ncbi:hypothetical protein M2337_003258 [Sphingobium sp. B2D3A]|uniref:hypothetical protein n=1 Tax=unclassified Sphingobium TaxID=2611147 RepID=UPI002223F27B|nr:MULTISPECIES: hypothetical protein [unclassified Sphingobium]MCW2339025.1 hypothetical protein [Sphingobium sp. B2D3A]MCW2349591.1 hypothetical protein [Sphingobium sp. B12D2B]MCW2385450.1 hypothetical protein [Sphingobium sp. B2D3D]